MGIGYIVDTLTPVDIQKIVKIGSKVIKIYEGVLYRENFIVSPFRNVIDKLFAVRQKYKDENIDFLKILVKLFLSSSYGEQIRKDIKESFACKSEHTMMSEYDEKVLDYGKISHGTYIIKVIDHKELEVDVKKLNTMPLHLGSFVLPNSKRIINNFIDAFKGFYTNDFYYGDTDSLYIENKQWEIMDKFRLVGKNLLQRLNDYKVGGNWFVFFSRTRNKVLFNYI